MSPRDAVQNRLFAALSPKGKRIAIAEDVIKAIQDKLYFATTGYYVDVSAYLTDLAQVVSKLPGGSMSCMVCGIGAGCVSIGRLFNDVDDVPLEDKFAAPGTSMGARDAYQLIERYFSTRTRRLIEIAFEQDEDYANGSATSDSWETPDEDDNPFVSGQEAAETVAWSRKYSNETTRLLAIWTNIRDNNGEFQASYHPAV